MKRKKIVCLLLSGLLTMGLVSGCGSSSSDEGGDAKNETKTEDTKKDDAAKEEASGDDHSSYGVVGITDKT